MATILFVTGEQRQVQPANGKSFTLRELQKIVDGYIELVALRDGRLMYVNEEGKLRHLPVNDSATKLVRDRLDDVIVGTAVVGTREEMGAD